MGDLHGKPKVVGRPLVPAGDGVDTWYAIERGIQFHRVEVPALEFQPLALCEFFGIKPAAPIGIGPTRGADMKTRMGDLLFHEATFSEL